MKTNPRFFVFMILASIFSTAGMAQIAPGSDFGCSIAYSFKKNNGNGWGVCHGDAQLRVLFSPTALSENIPFLTAIYYQGHPLTNILLPASGDIVTRGQGYVTYCLTGLPQKNNGNIFGHIPHLAKLVLEFTYPNGMMCRTDFIN